MRRFRIWGPVIGTVAVVGAVAAVVALRPWEAAAGDTQVAGFTRHVDAVQNTASEPNWIRPGSGLFGLVPYHNCLLGFGGVDNRSGTSPAFWNDPRNGCDRLTIVPETGEPADTAGSHYTDTTPIAGTVLANGTVVTVATARDANDYFSSSGLVFARDRAGNRTQLAELNPPENADVEFMQRRGHVNFYAVTTGVDGSLFVGGSQSDPASRNDGEPRLWRSTDGGTTLTPVTLPGAWMYSGYLMTIASDGPTMIAAGSGTVRDGRGQHLLVWTSIDAGRTWTPAPGNQPEIMYANAAMHTRDGWLVATSTDQNHAPVILRSTDGTRWSAVDLPNATNGGDVVGLAVDRRTGTVYAAGWTGKLLGNAIHDPKTCATVWSATDHAQTWRASTLGCDIAIPVAETTLSNGAIVIASNADLWTHQPV